MKKIYKIFCKIEEVICASLFLGIIALVFASAVCRYLKIPLQWSIDVTQLIFAWVAFLGADIAMRNGKLIGVGLITEKLPPKTAHALAIFCNIFILFILAIFIYYGFKLGINSWNRQFQTLPVSYSFVTFSLPVSSIFMVMSTIGNIHKINKNHKKEGAK